jgi:hypothetical protein
MGKVVVRYKVKPERVEENERLIGKVYEELAESAPAGLRYATFRLEDGVSFVHVVVEHDVERPDSLADVPAFQAFVADIADRCDVPPLAMGGAVVGAYR